jgi:hypothetical protein
MVWQGHGLGKQYRVLGGGGSTFALARISFLALPDELRGLGYVVSPAGTTMRINPHGTVEVIAASQSSMPPVRRLTHAGIEQVNIYELTRHARAMS